MAVEEEGVDEEEEEEEEEAEEEEEETLSFCCCFVEGGFGGIGIGNGMAKLSSLGLDLDEVDVFVGGAGKTVSSELESFTVFCFFK